jgi:hypothetical protein
VKYLTGLGQSLAVLTSAGNVTTARLCPNPVKYFMLLRGVPPTQKHVVMKKFKSKYIEYM